MYTSILMYIYMLYIYIYIYIYREREIHIVEVFGKEWSFADARPGASAACSAPCVCMKMNNNETTCFKQLMCNKESAPCV